MMSMNMQEGGYGVIKSEQEQEQVKCPRCDSTNTKFCYYNNYNLSQPRHFCKNCRRYWTKGGALRNIPVGGGSRKSSSSSSSSSSAAAAAANKRPSAAANSKRPAAAADPEGQFGQVSFSSLLASDGPFGQGSDTGRGGDAWTGWPDLAIYTTPGSSFQ